MVQKGFIVMTLVVAVVVMLVLMVVSAAKAEAPTPLTRADLAPIETAVARMQTPTATAVVMVPTPTRTPLLVEICIEGVFLAPTEWGMVALGDQTICGRELRFSEIHGPSAYENPLR